MRAFSFVPVDIVDDVGLKQKIASWHQVVHDEVLIGSHSDVVTNAQWAQHVEHLAHQSPLTVHLSTVADTCLQKWVSLSFPSLSSPSFLSPWLPSPSGTYPLNSDRRSEEALRAPTTFGPIALWCFWFGDSKDTWPVKVFFLQSPEAVSFRKSLMSSFFIIYTFFEDHKIECLLKAQKGFTCYLFCRTLSVSKTPRSYLWISAVFVNEWDDGANVLFFDDIESFWAVNEYAVEYVQHTWTHTSQWQ